MNQREEIQIIRKLGDEIGYGHLMHIASALLRQKRDGGDGFVPASFSFLKEDHKKIIQQYSDHYDKVVDLNFRYRLRDKYMKNND